MGSDESTLSLGRASRALPGARRLFVLSDDAPRAVSLPTRGSLTVGRGDGVDIRLDDQAISRRHLTLHLGETVTLEDLRSANGTRVRGRALSPGETVELAPGDAVEIGRTMLVLQRGPPSPQCRRVRVHTHDEFATRVEDECGRAERSGRSFAVLRIQVTAGAAATADERLASEVQPGDVLGVYVPGDYQVLLVDCDPPLAAARAQRLAAAVSGGKQVPKVGAAHFPTDGTTSALLLERANAALRGSDPPRETGAPVLVREGAMAALRRIVGRIAASNISVLITGETGVGKSMLAAEIHRRSARAAGPFVALNCAELADSLFETELFGHVEGAFTSAKGAKTGLIEAAHGGTLFLDEIGEVPVAIQAKLLRVLEERQVRRVGRLKSQPVDIRVVSATSRDLEAASEAGAFRSDLYFRLNGITVSVPPLRERVEEIEALARAFLERAAREAGARAPELTPEALVALRRYSWRGNIRELRNVMERAQVLCPDRITPDQLPAERNSGTVHAPPPAPMDERERIMDALLRCGGNQTRAARLLGFGRRTLVNRLEKYGLPRPQPKR